MVVNKKKMNVTSVRLSEYEMSTLRDAEGTLHLLFAKLTAKDNITRVAHVVQGLEDLLEELEDNGYSIVEFDELEDK